MDEWIGISNGKLHNIGIRLGLAINWIKVPRPFLERRLMRRFRDALIGIEAVFGPLFPQKCDSGDSHLAARSAWRIQVTESHLGQRKAREISEHASHVRTGD